MKIVELKIDDSSFSGIDAVALVESPAIEQDFIAFNKVNMADMTYNDYPQAAVDAAKRGVELNQKNNMKCATQVGKVRAQQLINGENLSLDTIQRMRSFLIRQKGNYELATKRKDYNACGYISYLLWGGEAALPWAEKKLRQSGMKFEFETINNEGLLEGNDVYLISCSNGKIDKSAPAAELYTSPLFAKSLSYSRKNAEDDYINILSAKYHLVALNQVISPYDLTLKNFSRQDKKDWANKVYSQILDKYDLQYDRFMFLAGADYTDELMSKFKYKTDVLEGMRIGERMEYLDKFYIVTNNEAYATKHDFTLVNPEATILEELLALEFAEPTLDDACLPGYKAIGLKMKNGRKVPNCVPKEKLAEDVLHYTADGKLYEGPTHKDIDGRLMTGAVHTEDSVFLYHKDKLSQTLVICKECGHSWSIEDGGDDLYICHKCGYDNNPDLEEFEINVSGLPNFVNEASSGKKLNFAAELQEKQMLVGPLMTPSKLIPRKDENGDEYMVYFTADTIEKIAYKMMQDKLVDKVNIEHDSNDSVADVYLVETWIVKDPEHDKATLYGFSPVLGEWYGIYKVGNGRVWNEYVKTGKVKGFSVEGFFYNNLLTTK